MRTEISYDMVTLLIDHFVLPLWERSGSWGWSWRTSNLTKMMKLYKIKPTIVWNFVTVLTPWYSILSNPLVHPISNIGRDHQLLYITYQEKFWRKQPDLYWELHVYAEHVSPLGLPSLYSGNLGYSGTYLRNVRN